MENKPTADLPPEAELSSEPSGPLSDGSSQPSPSPGSDTPPSRKPGALGHLLGLHNFYFFIFILLILIALGAILAVIKFDQSNNKTKTGSLTDQQLTELKGSTAVVGDSQQLLDVQSNSIFEGQVLLRNNLEVAGSLKVGGPLSLPSVTISGASTLGQVAVNGNLAVAGVTTLQKGLTVAGPVSFGGAVSISQLNVTSLQLTGDLVVSRHINSSGGIPGKNNGIALGGGGTVSISGNDTAGTITINTGGSPPSGCFGTFNFVQRFSTTPHVIVSPSNSSAGALDYYTNRSNTSFSLCTANAPAGGTTYVFDYIVIN